jgi:hypothetical protein
MREHRTSYKNVAPSGDIASSVMVCVITVPASHTQKLGLGFPVALGDMAASRTLPAGIAWIDNRNRDACALGLVHDEGPKLGEAPIVQTVPLLFLGLNLSSDMRQIFQRDSETGAFSSGDDAFGNAMVFVFLEPFLLAAHGTKAALGALVPTRCNVARRLA